MKLRIWVSIALFIMVLALGITAAVSATRISDEYQERAKEVEALVAAEDWAGAKQRITQLSEDWTGLRPVLQAWMLHVDTDDVSNMLSLVAVSVERQDLDQSLYHLVELRETLDHIAHRDALTLHNIL